MHQVERILLPSPYEAHLLALCTDHVFPPDTSNQQVFEVVAENVIWSTMEGFNGTPRAVRASALVVMALLTRSRSRRLIGTIFAYGQTNSGKTYTMKGSSKNPGMIPLAIQDVFSYIKQVACSYQE